ncbi:MAG: hypothetical protein K6G50_02820 [bacterium]|nr:hypothetical protein [bacterium]
MSMNMLGANINTTQMGFAQNLVSPRDNEATSILARANEQEEANLATLRQDENAEAGNVAKGARANEAKPQSAVQQTQAQQQAQQSGETAEAQQPQQGQQTADTAMRNLRLAMSDNTKQLQAQFGNNTQETNATNQQNMTQDARRTVMLRNLENMVNMQLAQYTGNEPYTRANYRQILGTLTQMQGGNKTGKAQDGQSTSATDDAAWAAESNEAGGAQPNEKANSVYKLYSGQAAKTLSFLTSSQEKNSASKDFDVVA